MECPVCNRFRSLTDPKVTVRSEFFEWGIVSVDLRVFQSCDECGKELRERSFSFTHELTDPANDQPLGGGATARLLPDSMVEVEYILPYPDQNGDDREWWHIETFCLRRMESCI